MSSAKTAVRLEFDACGCLAGRCAIVIRGGESASTSQGSVRLLTFFVLFCFWPLSNPARPEDWHKHKDHLDLDLVVFSYDQFGKCIETISHR